MLINMYTKVKNNPTLVVSVVGAALATAYELQTEFATQTVTRTAGFFLLSNALLGVSAYGVKKVYDSGVIHSIASSASGFVLGSCQKLFNRNAMNAASNPQDGNHSLQVLALNEVQNNVPKEEEIVQEQVIDPVVVAKPQTRRGRPGK